MDKYTKIKHLFEQNRDEENAVKMSKYMRDLFKFYGLATPIRKSFYKDLLKEEKVIIIKIILQQRERLQAAVLYNQFQSTTSAMSTF